MHVQSWPKILAPLVNMIKEGSENNPFDPFILKKKSQKSKLSLDNKNFNWGEISSLNKKHSLIHIGQNYWHP